MLKSEMQKKIKSLYPMSKSWARKVEKMKASQVYAIYCKNFWADGSRKPATRKRDQIPGQMSMTDFIQM